MDIPLYIVCIVVLVLISAFFSATETAYSSFNKIRVKSLAAGGDKRAKRVIKLSDNYDKLLTTILIGNNIVNVLATTLSGLLFLKIFIERPGLASTISTIVMTVIVLIFGEITPKTIAKRHPEGFAMGISRAIQIIDIIFTPLDWIFGSIQKLLDMMKKGNDSVITDDELITYVDEAETDGGIDENESELIRSAIEFDDMKVKDIFTPRVDVDAVSLDQDMDSVLAVFRESGHSRLPVYVDTIDNIVGILNVKDFFDAYISGEKSISNVVSEKVIYAAPSMRISDLMRQLQQYKNHIAVVVDEFGGTHGIVTLEDILEELVGEIWDEHDEVIEYFVLKDGGKFDVDCDVSFSDFVDYFKLRIDEDDYDVTQLSGLIADLLEKVPHEGDVVEFCNLRITVTLVEHMKAEKCEVEVLPADEEGDDD